MKRVKREAPGRRKRRPQEPRSALRRKVEVAPALDDEPAIAEISERPPLRVTIVGVGASAGGLEAFTQVLEGLGEDRFIAELSHELRTPLTPIVAAIASLKDRSDVPAFLRPTLEMIQRNVEVEARLIDDLLDVSRIAQNRLHVELAVVDAHEVLREVAATVEAEIRSRELEFSLDLGAESSSVLADVLRLRQIFWNLMLNAVRNTPRGGSITLQSTNVDRDLRVAVRDTGVGIEQSRLEQIFAAFSRETPGPTRSGEGLGLGLSIVKGLVEAHHGRIVAFSQGPGEGSTFVVELPTVDAATEADAPPAMVPAPSPGRRKRRPPSARSHAPTRVLVVEDHADTREALQAYLRIKGYEVLLAKDVASALEQAREPVDVIVCDIGLPDGTGFDLVRRLSADQPVKAIALTGYGAPRDVELASRAGFSAHLTKPVAVDQLVATIESLIERRDT